MHMSQVTELDSQADSISFPNSCDIALLINNEQAERKELKKWRTLLLGAFLFLAINTGLNLYTLPSTGDYLAQKLGISQLGVFMLGTLAFLFHGLFGIPIHFFVKEFGFKVAVLTISSLQMLGALSVHISLLHQTAAKCLGMMVTGQLANVAAFAILLESATQYASLWEEMDKNVFVSGSIFAAMLVGNVIKSAALGAAAMDFVSAGEFLKKLALSRVSLAGIVLVIVSVFLPKTPSTFHQGIPKKNKLSCRDLANFFCKEVNLVQTAFALYFALFNTSFMHLKSSIAMVFQTLSASANLIELAAALTGAIGILCGAAIMRITVKLKIVAASFTIMAASLMMLFTIFSTSENSASLSVLFVTLWGIAGSGWLAIGLKHAFAASQTNLLVEFSSTISLAMGSLYTVVLSVLYGWIVNIFGVEFFGYSTTALYGLCFLLVLLSREESVANLYQNVGPH